MRCPWRRKTRQGPFPVVFGVAYRIIHHWWDQTGATPRIGRLTATQHVLVRWGLRPRIPPPGAFRDPRGRDPARGRAKDASCIPAGGRCGCIGWGNRPAAHHGGGGGGLPALAPDRSGFWGRRGISGPFSRIYGTIIATGAARQSRDGAFTPPRGWPAAGAWPPDFSRSLRPRGVTRGGPDALSCCTLRMIERSRRVPRDIADRHERGRLHPRAAAGRGRFDSRVQVPIPQGEPRIRARADNYRITHRHVPLPSSSGCRTTPRLPPPEPPRPHPGSGASSPGPLTGASTRAPPRS